MIPSRGASAVCSPPVPAAALRASCSRSPCCCPQRRSPRSQLGRMFCCFTQTRCSWRPMPSLTASCDQFSVRTPHPGPLLHRGARPLVVPRQGGGARGARPPASEIRQPQLGPGRSGRASRPSILRHRATIFPGVPVVFVAAREAVPADVPLPPERHGDVAGSRLARQRGAHPVTPPGHEPPDIATFPSSSPPTSSHPGPAAAVLLLQASERW
jgi:hypothetical protein